MTQAQYTTELRYIRNVSATTLELYKYAFQPAENGTNRRRNRCCRGKGFHCRLRQGFKGAGRHR